MFEYHIPLEPDGIPTPEILQEFHDHWKSILCPDNDRKATNYGARCAAFVTLLGGR